MSTEDSYRLKAAELRRHARADRNVSSRLEWELLALGYDRLADQARRNAQNNILYEYHSQAVETKRQLGRQISQAEQRQQALRSKRDR